MAEIEKMQQYIKRTNLKENDKYTLHSNECIAILGIKDRCDATWLAFQFGMAKGYRMAKNEIK